jgi:hypothetical protein
LNAAAEGKAATVQLDEAVERLQHGAQTLQGGNSSLQAMMAVTQQAQLQSVFTQMKIQLKTATATASALKKSIAESERVIQLAQISPFYQATRKTVNVLFVPYDNLSRAEVGAAVYDCYLQIFACYQVGTIKQVFDAEQYSRHPLFRTEIKGQYVEVDIDRDSAKSAVVFIGRKPLFL